MPLLSWDTCILTSFAYQTLKCTHRFLQSYQRMQTTYQAVLSVFLLQLQLRQFEYFYVLLYAMLSFQV